MKKLLIALLSLTTIIAIAIFTYIASNKAPKYSVEYTTKDAENVLTRIDATVTQGKLEDLEGGNTSVTVENGTPINIKTELTSAEATALANQWANMWVYAPLTNSSIRINDDNTIDYTGTFDVNRALGYARATGISENIVKAVQTFIKPFGASFPIYGHGTLSITDNNTNATLTHFNIGSVPVPQNMLTKYKDDVDSFVTKQLSPDSRYKINSLVVKEGKLQVDAILPQNITYYK